jgi:hypothetical protein
MTDLNEVAEAVSAGYDELRQAAEMYSDHQDFRVATENRISSMQIDVGQGYAEYAKSLRGQEDELGKRMVAIYKEAVSPGIQDWAKKTAGIGKTSPHMLARLLGHLGHPRLAVPKYWVENPDLDEGEWGSEENPKRMLVQGEPFLRSMGQLWQYCGHGAPSRRRKDMTQEEAMAMGRPMCKMLVHLLAEGVVKAQVRNNDGEKIAIGPLGEHFLATKARYAERTHTGPCPGGPMVMRMPGGGKRAVIVRCKVDGRYAEAGDPFQASHINAIGYRHLGKKILMELYDAAYEDWCEADQRSLENHPVSAHAS